jgi:hypothetical protein
MMRAISEKSTGQLVDELITNAFKTAYAARTGASVEEFELRYGLLRSVLLQRLGQDVADIIHDLCVVSLATWQAQEVVMHEPDDRVAASAGRQAQRMNARRSHIIREIDRLVGEARISITTKTYG